MQEPVNRLILMLKQEGFSLEAHTLWHSILENLASDYVIIACTDISVCLNAADNPSHLIFLDSNKILAEATYERYLRIEPGSLS